MCVCVCGDWLQEEEGGGAGRVLRVGKGDAEILGGAQAGAGACGGLRGWRGGTGGNRRRRVSGGWMNAAEEAPLWMQKTFVVVDGEFATWRTRFERGSVLRRQKEGIDLGRVVGAIQSFHCLLSRSTPLGHSPVLRFLGIVTRLDTVGSRP